MKKLTNYLFIIVGNILEALAIGSIALRQNISLGGVSGLAKVIGNVLPISISIIIYAINIILLLLAYYFINKDFVKKTILSAIIFPIFLEFAMKIDTLDVLSNDLFLASVIAGCLLGIGSGFILRGNGSSGGFDIVAVILNKIFEIKTATVIAIFDTCILCLQINANNLLLSIYGITMIIVTSLMINKIITKENDEVKMMVFTNKIDDIKNMLMNEEDCGVTLLDAQSGYQGNTIKVILSIMPYNKIQQCKQSVLRVDSNAFIVLENVQAAYTGNYRLRKPEDYK